MFILFIFVIIIWEWIWFSFFLLLSLVHFVLPSFEVSFNHNVALIYSRILEEVNPLIGNIWSQIETAKMGIKNDRRKWNSRETKITLYKPWNIFYALLKTNRMVFSVHFGVSTQASSNRERLDAFCPFWLWLIECFWFGRASASHTYVCGRGVFCVLACSFDWKKNNKREREMKKANA